MDHSPALTTFSVVIPTYNRAAMVMNAVHSVLRQTYRHLEVVVVDDGSTDDTADRVKAIADSRVRYHYQDNAERAVARNSGAAIARGGWVIFLDSDDELLPDHLQRVHERIQQDAATSVFVSGYEIVNHGGSIDYSFSRSGLLTLNDLCFGNYASCCAVTLRRELFLEERFNEERGLLNFEDWELWLRIASRCDMQCIPFVTVRVTNHGGRSVKNFGDTLPGRIKCLQRAVFTANAGIRESGRLRARFLGGTLSYTALHLVLEGQKAQAFRSLLAAILRYPALLTYRRTFAVLKHLL